MTINYKSIGLVVAGIVIGLIISSLGGSKASLGGIYHQTVEEFYAGLKAGTSNQLVISDTGAITTSGALSTTGDSTVSGGTFTVTTANTATSTLIVGCVQSYATSTATAMKLQFTASTTAPTNGSGIIPVISYGACPNL